MRVHVAADEEMVCNKVAWRTQKDEAEAAQDVEEAQAQQAPDLHGPGTQLARATCSNPDVREGQDRKYRSSGTTASIATAALRAAGTMFPDPGDVIWQWEHRTGFKNYDFRATARIEDAFQRGLPRVRLKAGKLDDTPMELFFYDMIQFDPKTGNCRKILRIGPTGFWQSLRRRVNELARLIGTGRSQRMVFAQYERQRQDLRRGLDDKDYSVCDFYHETGCCATAAKSNLFFIFSMLAVALNAIWIGIDADLNTSATLAQAAPGFQVVEHCFCAAFSTEVAIRFLAFRLKRDCMKDAWFLFDTSLVVLMVGETWLLPLVLVIVGQQQLDHGVKGLTILRTVRMMRLTRLGRIARLLRAVPEVLTLLKGIVEAMRSVFFTLLLQFVLLYVFGVVFKIQSEEDEMLKQIFPDVPASMWLLLLSGTFLDAPSVVANAVGAESPVLAGLFLLFIFLSSFMVLNMLIGILCDVVHQVALNEQEEAAVAFLKSTLLEILECHDKDNDRQIHRDEFELLMRNPEMHFVLTRFGVNVIDLITLKDVLFEDKDCALEGEDDFDISPVPSTARSPARSPTRSLRKLSFNEFLQVVLRLRGGNNATVTDIVDLREYVRQRLDRMDWRLTGQPAAQGAAHGPQLRSLRTMKSMAASSSGPSPIKRDVSFGAEAGSARLELPEACFARVLPGILKSEIGYQEVGKSVADTLLVRLSELSAGQHEIAIKQVAWQNDVADKQAELAQGLKAAQIEIAKVARAMEAFQNDRGKERGLT